MPARQKYPTPAQGMRVALGESLTRGDTFDYAWHEAFHAIRYPHALDERVDWELALVSTKAAWRASYERVLDNNERIFSALDPQNGPIELQAVA